MRLKDHLAEVARAHPEATSRDIAAALSDVLDEAFRDALLQIDLPASPSPAQRKLVEFRLQRLPSRSRDSRRFQIDERDAFLQGLRHLKLRLNGMSTGTDDFEMVTEDGGSNNFPILVVSRESLGARARPDGHHAGGQLEIGPVGENTQDLRLASRGLFVSTESMAEDLLSKPYVLLGEILEAKIAADQGISEIVTHIETVARRFDDLSPPYGTVVVDWIRDIEWPRWEKLVIELVPRRGSFDERLHLWEEFDRDLRDKVRQSIRDAKRGQKVNLRRLSENVFVHMELLEA